MRWVLWLLMKWFAVLLATVLSVIVQGAKIAALTAIGIPTLTAAFILVTWLFLLPRQKSD